MPDYSRYYDPSLAAPGLTGLTQMLGNLARLWAMKRAAATKLGLPPGTGIRDLQAFAQARDTQAAQQAAIYNQILRFGQPGTEEYEKALEGISGEEFAYQEKRPILGWLTGDPIRARKEFTTPLFSPEVQVQLRQGALERRGEDYGARAAYQRALDVAEVPHITAMKYWPEGKEATRWSPGQGPSWSLGEETGALYDVARAAKAKRTGTDGTPIINNLAQLENVEDIYLWTHTEEGERVPIQVTDNAQVNAAYQQFGNDMLRVPIDQLDAAYQNAVSQLDTMRGARDPATGQVVTDTDVEQAKAWLAGERESIYWTLKQKPPAIQAPTQTEQIKPTTPTPPPGQTPTTTFNWSEYR